MKRQLEEVRKLAQAKLDARQEPPWSWYQYMKLVETCNAILAGINTTRQTGSSLQPGPLRGNVIPLVEATHQPSTAQRHQDVEPVPMPM